MRSLLQYEATRLSVGIFGDGSCFPYTALVQTPLFSTADLQLQLTPWQEHQDALGEESSEPSQLADVSAILLAYVPGFCLGVSIDRGPQNRPQYIMVSIIGTPRKRHLVY